MLTLTLRPGNEQIVIGKAGDVLTGPIVLKPERKGEHGMKLGIEAQRDVVIVREELEQENVTE